ncbi:baculoviral IAP repeat-containing protein 7-A isoform X2 [Solenopsis invicta]|uniref:baculoviral IAP repeat-containing protein 7-A isoform X2 n=1 Tax=Solenopsis invicta TaxID=13686 RepID=UPI00193C8F80|nr:baculoviral IAP repeat-containing protein 7-A isoform X2 [Solenopsis invicta]
MTFQYYYIIIKSYKISLFALFVQVMLQLSKLSARFDSARMNVEESRLKTFREWPTNAAVDPARLAKAGFYYTGNNSEVQCFMCNVKIADWNYGDQAMVRHRITSPNCPFVISPTGTCNVPLIPVSADNAAAASTTCQQSSDPHSNSENSQSVPQRSSLIREYSDLAQRLLSFRNWPKTNIIHPKELAEAGFYYLQDKDMVECAFCRGVLMNWKHGDDPDSSHRLYFPNCDFYMRHNETDGIHTHKGPQRPEYAMYEKRLQTFRGWPRDLKQTPEMLAEAGFYYCGYEDQVRCFYCDGGLRTWQPTDDVWIEHARWFEKCGFVNLVRGHDFVKHCINNRTPLDLSIITGVPEENNAAESLVESLTSTSRSREPDTLSVADIVETSAASFPTVSQLGESDTAISVTETMVTSPLTVLQSSVQMTHAAVEKLLETTLVKAALEIGVHIGRVKKALKKRMESVGKPYTDVIQLIQDILYDQIIEKDNRPDDNTSNSPTSELNNLFHQITMQITVNSTNKNSTQKSDTFERDLEKRKTDNESDELMFLREENRKLREARLCKVCMDHDLAVVFLPCGHLATCNHCAPALANCPLCRLGIRAYTLTRAGIGRLLSSLLSFFLPSSLLYSTYPKGQMQDSPVWPSSPEYFPHSYVWVNRHLVVRCDPVDWNRVIVTPAG